MSGLSAIQKNIQVLTQRLQTLTETPPEIVIASKYASIDQIRAVVKAGILNLGENKLQDAILKQQQLNDDRVKWHFIGHLQRNKVRKVLAHFDCIQSVDRIELAEKINEVSAELGRQMSVLLQVNIAKDPAKHGFDPELIKDQLTQIFQFQNLNIEGIMVIIPLLDTHEAQLQYFAKARDLFDVIRQDYPEMSVLSMGMSQDFEAAVAAGSTMIRIGRSIFKESIL
ncbi:MAG: YggS family pyridoxal phosphate-dependent enzyme [Actinobacteria bacterium]|nr:YggS family pyridoxal phosphate-dependent enzyme [Actinomycetota bacterium]